MFMVDYYTLAKFRLDILNEEYKKLCALPTDKYLSPETTKRLDELRSGMLDIVKEMNKRLRKSSQ